MNASVQKALENIDITYDNLIQIAKKSNAAKREGRSARDDYLLANYRQSRR